eukprot:scaffold23145_cov101-Isochrysis_galbana.AAC.1
MSGLPVCSFFHWKIFAKKIYLPSTFPVGTCLHSRPWTLVLMAEMEGDGYERRERGSGPLCLVVSPPTTSRKRTTRCGSSVMERRSGTADAPHTTGT